LTKCKAGGADQDLKRFRVVCRQRGCRGDEESNKAVGSYHGRIIMIQGGVEKSHASCSRPKEAGEDGCHSRRISRA
jgi:hypothetical protein